MSQRSRAAGISLIEVVVAVGIFGLLVGGLTALLLSGTRSKDEIFAEFKSQGQARRALEGLANELRGMGVAETGAYPLAKAGESEIIFYTNLDSSQARERVRYFTDGVALKKGVIKAVGNPPGYSADQEEISAAAEGLVPTSTPLFSYYDKNYTGFEPPLPQPVDVTKVRLVLISFSLDQNPARPPAARPWRVQAELRNLKDNY